MNHPTAREALEACRPGHNDLTLPELAEAAQAVGESAAWHQAFEQTQRVDTAIAAALHGVPVPAGLEDRLLAALVAAEAAERAAEPVSEAGVPDQPAGQISARLAVPPPPARTSRRRWITAAMATAATLAFVAWGVNHWSRAPRISPESLGMEAVAWTVGLPEAWLALEDAPRGQRPLDRQVRIAPRGWQTVETAYDAHTAVYDVSRQRGTALLFVFAPRSVPADLATTATRVSATGGWGAAVWQRGGQVYVLVVEERRQKLEDFLARPTAEVVARRPSFVIGRTS